MEGPASSQGTASAGRTSQHFEWLDVLRGLSALAVVLHHVRVDLWVGWNAIQGAPQNYSALDRAVAWLSVPTPFFGSAVMLFFLVSGFCVHLPHAAGRRPLELASYARRRFYRIYPPYLAAVVLTVGVEAILAARGVTASPASHVVKTVLMVQNYGVEAGQLVANPSLWSLPVEIELYLAYPVFAWLLARLGLRVSLLASGAVSALVAALSIARVWSGSPFHAATNFALFWIIWCMGAALAEGVALGALPRWKPWMSFSTVLALGAALAVSGLKRLPSELGFFAWAAFYGGVLLWGLSRPDPLRVLSARAKAPLLLLGTISYSLYLVHFPLFRLAGMLWVDAFGAKPSNFVVSVAASLLVLPLAWLFYTCVELPSHRLAKGRGAAKAAPVPSA